MVFDLAFFWLEVAAQCSLSISIFESPSSSFLPTPRHAHFGTSQERNGTSVETQSWAVIEMKYSGASPGQLFKDFD